MDWNELILTVNAADIDRAGDIAHMTVPYGIYIEDYRNLEQETLEVAHIDLIDEELLAKDRSKGLLHIYISPEENPAEAVAFLAERFTAAGIAYTLTTRICRNEDWENNWKAYFKPMEIGNKLLIRPVWERVEDTHARAVFSIEPGLAFGIGSHETTRLCLEALEERVSEETTVLDIGCGSGILGICALFAGGENGDRGRFGPHGGKTAVENGHLNGFGPPAYTVIQGTLLTKSAAPTALSPPTSWLTRLSPCVKPCRHCLTRTGYLSPPVSSTRARTRFSPRLPTTGLPYSTTGKRRLGLL
jgi:ribosomal protein L11 methyltransferase